MTDDARVDCPICGNTVYPVKRSADFGCLTALGCFACLVGWIAIPIALVLLLVSNFRKPSQCPVCKYDVFSRKLESIRLTSTFLLSEYEADTRMADAQFRGKVLIITGSVLASGKAGIGPYVDLAGDGENRVYCALPSGVERKMELYAVGDRITVIGTVNRQGPQGLLFTCRDILHEFADLPRFDRSQITQQYCRACGNQRVSPDDYFCRSCGAPYG